MRTISYCISFTIIIALAACGQNKNVVSYSEKTSALVSQIAEDNYIGTEIVGRGGGPSDAYKRRRQLIETTPLKELKSLAYNPNAAVSLTAFQGLCEKGAHDVPKILENVYAKENVQVHVIRGDLSFRMSTLEYAYGYILGLTLPGDEVHHNALVDYTISLDLQKKLKQTIVEFNSSSPKE